MQQHWLFKERAKRAGFLKQFFSLTESPYPTLSRNGTKITQNIGFENFLMDEMSFLSRNTVSKANDLVGK